MHQTIVRLLLGAFLVVVCAGAQCVKSKPPALPTKIPTKVEYFKEKQGHTKTPHGMIDLDSVKETPDGVEYTTRDPKTGEVRRWQVVLERTPTGWRVPPGERGEPKQIN